MPKRFGVWIEDENGNPVERVALEDYHQAMLRSLMGMVEADAEDRRRASSPLPPFTSRANADPEGA